MTVREIDVRFANEVLNRMNDYDEHGELNPESAEKIKEMIAIDKEDRELKLEGCLRVISRAEASIESAKAMKEQYEMVIRSESKSLEFLEKCILDSMKLRGETKVTTQSGLSISIAKAGKRGIDYSLLDLMLKSDYTKIPSKFIRKTETIALAKDYIQQEAKLLCDDPDDVEKNKLLQDQLGVSYLPAKESLKIGKRKTKGNSGE